MRTHWKKWLPGLLALALVYWTIAPLIALYRINAAAAAGDSDALRGTVDFEALRESLKIQLTASLRSRTFGTSRFIPVARMGTRVAAALVEAPVNLLVTPLGIHYMLRGYLFEQDEFPPTIDPDAPTLKGAVLSGYFSHFKGLDFFAVSMPADGGGALTLFLHREGLSWRLSNVLLPLTATQH